MTQGPRFWAAGVAMAFKLIESQKRWPTVHAPHLVALVRSGAGSRRARPDEQELNSKSRATDPQVITISPLRGTEVSRSDR